MAFQLDDIFRSLGCSWAYPICYLFLINYCQFVATMNLQMVSLLSWFPPLFCAVKNGTGTFPYEATNSTIHYFTLESRCQPRSNCTETRYLEKDPANPKCSKLSVEENFPRCPLPNSVMFYQAPAGHSTVMDFNTVCSRSVLVRSSDAVYFVGSAIAYFSYVPFGDVLGRRPIVVNMSICLVIMNLLTAVCPTAEFLLALRFLSGMVYANLTGLMNALMFELNPPNRRIPVSIFNQLTTSLAQVALGASSFVLQDWRTWLWFQTCLALVMAMLYIALLPESVRWQLFQYNNDTSYYADCEKKAREFVTKIIHGRIKMKPTPRNVTELVYMKEVLQYPGTLEIGGFSHRVLEENNPHINIYYSGRHETGTGSLDQVGSHERIFRTRTGPILRGYSEQRNSTESGDSDNSKMVSFKSNQALQVSKNRNRFKSKSDERSSLNQRNSLDSINLSTTLTATLSGEDEQPALRDYEKKKKITPVLWRCLGVFILLRTSVVVTYYSLALSTNELLTAGRFVSMIVLGLTELPVGPLVYLLDRRCQRRVGVSVVFLLTGLPFIALGIWTFIHDTIPVPAKYVFYLFCKCAATASVLMVNLYMVEVFPTTVRTAFSGYCSGVARTFTVIATLSPTAFQKYPQIISTVLGCLTTVCAFLVWLLPETKDRKLPQTPSDLQTIHLETKSLGETIRSARGSGPRLDDQGMGGGGQAGISHVIVTEPPAPTTEPEAALKDGKKTESEGKKKRGLKSSPRNRKVIFSQSGDMGPIVEEK